MSLKTVPAKESFTKWRNDPAYVAAYEALDEEFSLASQIVAARAKAGLSQSELARRMNTSQSAVARLEGGRTRPSTRTLEKVAAVTGMKLRINLVPA